MLTQEVRRLWTAYPSAHHRVAILKRQIAAVERTVTGTQREYEARFRSITDVQDVQMTPARAQISLEQTRPEKWQAAYALAFTTMHPAIDGLMAKYSRCGRSFALLSRRQQAVEIVEFQLRARRFPEAFADGVENFAGTLRVDLAWHLHIVAHLRAIGTGLSPKRVAPIA